MDKHNKMLCLTEALCKEYNLQDLANRFVSDTIPSDWLAGYTENYIKIWND